MAVAGIKLKLSTTEFADLVRQIGTFLPPPKATNVLAPIIRKAIKPTVNYLRYITPVGPTGNLKRAVTSKVVQYKEDGVAVGIVGYTRAGRGPASSAAGGSVRAGKDRAFHQWWLEYGTDERKITEAKPRVYARKSPTAPFSRTRGASVSHQVRPHTRTRNGKSYQVKGFSRVRDSAVTETVSGKGVLHTVQEQTPTYIASSFNELGPFSIIKSTGRDGRVETGPAYPRAFFRKSKTPIIIPAVQAGGSTGMPPLRTAWEQTQAVVAESLRRDLALTLEQAWAALRYRDSGTVSGTDTL